MSAFAISAANTRKKMEVGLPTTEVATTGSEILSVRLGYAWRDGEGEAALGLGLRVGRFDLGVARSLTRTSLATGSEPVHVSLGVVF